jgi:hypothetical protein
MGIAFINFSGPLSIVTRVLISILIDIDNSLLTALDLEGVFLTSITLFVADILIEKT